MISFSPNTHTAFNMQNCSSSGNQDCIAAYTSKGEIWRCIFPQVHTHALRNILTCLHEHLPSPLLSTQYSYPYIKTPIFALNSQYDTWQLKNILQLGCLPPNCSPTQMTFFENFRKVRSSPPILCVSCVDVC